MGVPVSKKRWQRWNIPPEARATLYTAYSEFPRPTRAQVESLADSIGVTPRRVKVWFQNQRQRNVSAVDARAQVLHMTYGYSIEDAKDHANVEYEMLQISVDDLLATDE